MDRILLVYAASKFTAFSVPKWKAKYQNRGKFFDLMVLGEPLDIFGAHDRPYVRFILFQIQKRIEILGINKVVVLSTKFDTKTKLGALKFVQHQVNYDLVPVAVRARPEYMYKRMMLKY